MLRPNVIADVKVGNTAVVQIEFIPEEGEELTPITSIDLRILDANRVEHICEWESLGTNNFRGTYDIPENGPAGVWVFRWETVVGPRATGELKFNVIGSSFFDSSGDSSVINHGTLLGLEDDDHPQYLSVFNVKAYGALGNGTTDDTAAIQATIAAMTVGGTLFFPAGIYKVTATLDFGAKWGIKVSGAGRSAARTSLSNAAVKIAYSGSGYCIQWAVGLPTAAFSGISIEDIHIFQAEGTPDGGIWLGNVSNATIRDVGISDFKNAGVNATGIKIGDTGTSGSQYSLLDNVRVSACDIGIDIVDSNGVRLMGCHLEGAELPPRTGTIGLRVGIAADSCTVIGCIIQDWDTLMRIRGSNGTYSAVRCENFITAAYHISGGYNSVWGGSISNAINGNVGTGVIMDGPVGYNVFFIGRIGAVAVQFTEPGGLHNTILGDPSLWGNVFPYKVNDFSTGNLTVAKQGPGAQNPALTMMSNATVGPTMTTTASFAQMVLNHAYASATRLSLQVRGVEALAIGDTNKLGFYGTNPVAKPAIAGAKDGNAALASLLTQLAALGLITDSSTA